MDVVGLTRTRVNQVMNGRFESDISINEREYWDALKAHQKAWREYQDYLKK